MTKNKKQTKLFKIILTAILIALNLVLERIVPSYKVENQDISFGFVAIAFAAAFLGTPYAAAVAGIGDFIGAMLFPFGAYFPGFTLTNCVYGIILGEFLYKNATVIKIVIAVLLNKIFCSLALNTLWICLLYDNGIGTFWIRFISRLPGIAILIMVELIVLILIFTRKSPTRRILEKRLSKFL